MDLSLQSRNLSSTSNSTSKCNMAQDEMECGLHRTSQSQPSTSNLAVASASLQSEASNVTNDIEHHHQQHQHQHQHQQLPPNHRGTISMPTPALPSLERPADTIAPSVTEDNAANYTNLNAKEAIRLKSPPPKSTNILQNGNNSNCQDGVNNAVCLHEAENLIDASHIKHASHYGGLSDVTVKPTVSTVDMSATNEHPSNSPHRYHHQHFVRQQSRYALAASSQNLSVSTNLTSKQHSTNQQSHRPLRSSIPTVDLSSNQMMEHARLISRQIELHERNELGMQQREQNKASHYFPQSLYQHLNTEQNIQKCLTLPIQHDMLPAAVPINDNRDNEKYQRNIKAYVRPPSPSLINAYKFHTKLDPLLPLNILTSDVLESLSSNEDVVDLMKPSKKDKRIKKQFLEKFIYLSPKDGNNQQKKLEFQEDKNTYEKESTQVQLNSPIYTKGNVSSTDKALKDIMPATYANLTFNLENEKHHFLQRKRQLSECHIIANAPNALHENAFHSVTDNCNVNVKMAETKSVENVGSIKNHTIDENNSAPLESSTTLSPKFAKFKKQTPILRHNTLNSDSADNLQNESDPAIHNENGINAEDLRMHYKCNDELRQESNIVPRGVHIDRDNIKRPSNLNNIYNTLNKSVTNTKLNAISKSGSDTYKSESDITEVSEITADVLIGIVESSKESPSKAVTTLDVTPQPHVESLKPQEKSSFEEVENKLEEMFAGIEDEPILRLQVTHSDAQLRLQTDSSKLFENLEQTMTTSMVKSPSNYLKHTYKDTKPLTSTSVLTTSHNGNKDTQTRVQEDSFKTKAAKKSLENDSVNILRNITTDDEEKEQPLDMYSSNGQTPQTKSHINVYDDCLNNKTNDVTHCNEGVNIYANASVSTSSRIVKKDTKATASRRKCIKSNRSKMDSAKKMQSTKINQFQINSKILEQGKTGRRSHRNTSCKTFNCDEGDSTHQQQQQTYNSEKLSRDFDVKHRSPFIMIKKDGSIAIVNTITATEDVNEKHAKIKKTTSYTQNHRNVRGLHSSTLGNNYDAYTPDSSWICVFCKLGPHKMGLGDLFGPYIATVNCEEYVNALNTVSNKYDSTSELNCKHTHIHKTNTKVRDCSLMLSTNSNDYYYPANETEVKRRKRASSGLFSHHDSVTGSRGAANLDNIAPDIFLGMCKTSDGNYEIWLHEDCAVWAPDILLIGSQLVGITNAVWNSLSTLCVYCYKPGATVCCLQRNCKQSAHFPCGRQAQWSFDESTFWVFCQKHSNSKRRTNSILLNTHTT